MVIDLLKVLTCSCGKPGVVIMDDLLLCSEDALEHYRRRREQTA